MKEEGKTEELTIESWGDISWGLFECIQQLSTFKCVFYDKVDLLYLFPYIWKHLENTKLCVIKQMAKGSDVLAVKYGGWITGAVLALLLFMSCQFAFSFF